MQVTDLELKGHTLVKGTGKGGHALQNVSRHLGIGELISGPKNPHLPNLPRSTIGILENIILENGCTHMISGSFPISK